MTGQAPVPNNITVLPYATRMVLLVVSYVLLGRLGLELALDNRQITLIWAPSGIALGFLLRWGRKYWPGVWLGALLVNLWVGISLPIAFVIAAGNTTSALVGARLLRQVRFHIGLDRQQDVVALLGLGALSAPVISATVGVASLKLAGQLAISPGMGWLGWWLGDACGVLLAAPFVLTIGARAPESDQGILKPSYLLLTLLTLVTSFLVFLPGTDTHLPLAFLPLPLIYLAALGFGGFGSVLVTAVIAAIAAMGTAWGMGPFVLADERQSMFVLWGFIGLCALSSLFVSALVARIHRTFRNLRESERRYRRVVEGRESLIVQMDAGRRFQHVNRAFEILLGKNRKLILGNTFVSTVAPDKLEETTQALTDWTAGPDDALEIEVCHLNKNGRPCHVYWSLVRENIEGRLHIHGFGRDFTEQRRAEDLFRDMMSSAPDAILIMSPEKRIVHANHAAEELFGFERGHLPGTAFAVLFPEHLGAASRQHLETLLEKPGKQLTSGRFELSAMRHDESCIQVEVRFGSFEAMDGLRISCFIRDLTRRKQEEERRLALETKMRDAQKLESLGLLAGGIAHDFNNLLMGILGNAGLVLEDMSASHEHRTFLERIQTAAMRSGELTRQLLAYAGKGTFVVEPLRLSDLVEEMAHLLRISVAPGASLEMNLDDRLPAIEADATQLRQVIMNLITNASDSLNSGRGTIGVQTELRRYRQEDLEHCFMGEHLEPGDYIVLEVCDNGCGMDLGTRGKIFDPFFTTKLTGRGLGLAAVQGIVKGHGGAIELDSLVGQGTTFRLLFPPYRKKAEVEMVPAVMESGWRGHGKILVIDDEEFVLHFTRDTLQRSGFEVILAANGQEGIDAFRKHHESLRLVLLDMTMPDKSGEVVYDHIHGLDERVPVILSSGHSEQEAREHFAERALAGYLQKPYGIKVLNALLRRVLD